MIHPGRTIAPIFLCTGLALASPAFAHDGLHQMTYLQSLLHELAWSDTLAVALTIGGFAAVAAWRYWRHRAARATL